jgi:hypothetical protein
MAWPTRFEQRARRPPIVAHQASMMGGASQASAASHAPPNAIALIQRWAAASAAPANSDQTSSHGTPRPRESRLTPSSGVTNDACRRNSGPSLAQLSPLARDEQARRGFLQNLGAALLPPDPALHALVHRHGPALSAERPFARYASRACLTRHAQARAEARRGLPCLCRACPPW